MALEFLVLNSQADFPQESPTPTESNHNSVRHVLCYKTFCAEWKPNPACALTMNRLAVRNLYRRLLRYPWMSYGVFPAVRSAANLIARRGGSAQLAPLAESWEGLGLEIREDLPANRDYFTPSLGEVVQEGHHLWRAPWIIKRLYDAAAVGDVERGRRYFGRLYGCQIVELDPTLTAIVPNGRIDARTGFALTEDGVILRRSNITKLPNEDRVRLAGIRDCEHETHSGECMSLLHPWATNYAHWLLDFLPRVILAQRTGFAGKVFIPATGPKFLAESLKLLGFEDEAIVKTSADYLQAERLAVPVPATYGLQSRPEYIREIGDRMRCAVGAKASTKRRRLYISRKAAERAIANEHEIQPILDKFGFETLQPEHMTFAEQVAAFSETEILMGPHGAGMYNALFMRPPAMAFEVLNEVRWEISVQRTCRMIGVEHWHHHARNLDFAVWTTHVDPKAFEESLAMSLDFLAWKQENRFSPDISQLSP